jgi:hypothetical protein
MSIIMKIPSRMGIIRLLITVLLVGHGVVSFAAVSSAVTVGDEYGEGLSFM